MLKAMEERGAEHRLKGVASEKNVLGKFTGNLNFFTETFHYSMVYYHIYGYILSLRSSVTIDCIVNLSPVLIVMFDTHVAYVDISV